MGRRLLILSCSQRKRHDPGLLPAIERYDGPPFQVLRKYLRTDPPDPPVVYVLSARFGLIPAEEPIPDYDQRMTRERAGELRPETMRTVQRIAAELKPARVFVNLGKDYIGAVNGWAESLAAGTVTFGKGGQGVRLAQLHAWLFDRKPRPSFTLDDDKL